MPLIHHIHSILQRFGSYDIGGYFLAFIHHLLADELKVPVVTI